MKRVVVTGLGMVSSLALNFEESWQQSLSGQCGIKPLQLIEMPGEPVQIAAEVALPPPFHAQNRCAAMAAMALEEALEGSGIDLRQGDPFRRGVFQGAASSGLPSAEAYVSNRLAAQNSHAAPLVRDLSNGITDSLALRLQAWGHRSTLMNACSSSLMAIGQAWALIAQGKLDWALAGGAENICRTTFAGFSCLKAMDTQPCRPFSEDRAGLTLGEGAVHLILEDLDHAKARGANIWAEVCGYGASMDAHHPTAPHPEGDGARRAMVMALEVAQLNAEAIDLVSAHATATPANDGAECLAIQRALGAHAPQISLCASKSQFGHTLAAAGAFGAAMALGALRDQVVSPTLRLEKQDPACNLDCTPLIARERSVRAALVNAFAFGGNNVCLALKRHEGK